MGSHEYDVVIIGAGSAGFAAARTLAAAGARLAVVEAGRELGGLCILRGCMPTKALLHGAELRHAIRQSASWGISVADVQVNTSRLFARKDQLIASFAADRRQQLEQGNWNLIRARARFADPHTLELDSGRRLTTDHVVIATGSELSIPEIPGLAEAGFLTSDSALRLSALPKSLIVLGAGAVALEFAQFFARFGTRVTVIQRSRHILRHIDEDLARELDAALTAEGLEILTDTQLLECASAQDHKQVRLRHQGREVTLTAEEIFVGLGRRPAVDGLDLPAGGVTQATSGLIQTNPRQQTSMSHIYAAGDCCGPHEIVHLAVQQGEVAARNILGRPSAMDDRLLLNVVFTDPAVATVGLTETAAQAAGIPIHRASYPFNDHGKSMILGARHGFVKLLAARHTGELLGAACIGPQAGELIHEPLIAIAQRMSAADWAGLPHYHPTLAEIWTYPAEDLAALTGTAI